MLLERLFGRKPKEKPAEQPAREETAPPGEEPAFVKFIGQCLDQAQKICQDYQIPMDYTAASIPKVSGLLDSYHRRYLHPEEDDSIIRDNAESFAEIFGVYIGETLLRLHPDRGYAWAEKEGFGLVVAKEGGYHIDAIAKAAKQIVNGREAGDEVGSFFDVAEELMEGRWPVE